MRESTTDSEITLSGSLDSYFPAPYRLSDGPSPRKRPRTASRTPSRPPSRGPSSTPSEVNYAREESTLRLFDAWSSIAERYSCPLGEDDEVDLRSGKVIKDRGFLRSTPRVAFGAFIPDEHEEPDEDELDELDAFGESRRVGGWSVPPVRTTDPEDARELEKFLEAEQARKTYGGEEEEEEQDCEEDVSDGYGGGEEQVEIAEGDYEEELRDGEGDEEEQEVESDAGEAIYCEEEVGDEMGEVENKDGEEGDQGDNLPRNYSLPQASKRRGIGNAIASTSRISKPQPATPSRSFATIASKSDDMYDSDDEFGAYKMDEASAIYRIVDNDPAPYVEDDDQDNYLEDDESEYAELPPSSSSVSSSPSKKYPNVDFIDLTSDGPDSPPVTPSPAKRPTKYPTIDFIDLSSDEIPISTPSRIRKEPAKPPTRPAFLQLATPPRSSSLSSPPPRGLFPNNGSPKAQQQQKYTRRTVSKGKGKA